MGQTIFSEHYQMCVGDDGAPRVLTRTGEAFTYKAVDLRSGDAAALTLLPISEVPAERREDFEKRVAAAQKVDHINVAKLLAFAKQEDNYVLVSELLQGESVGRWVALRGPLPADAALRTALQVSNGLEAARFHGLNHPAVQPSNVMIVPGQAAEGGWPYVKLMNFALAGITLEAMPQFASPEQLKGADVDFRSEIYSVGATMWFMMTGMIPGARDRTAESRMLRKLPKPVRGLLAQMLQPDPAQRPHDPAAFTDELHDCLALVDRGHAVGHKPGIPIVAPIQTPTAVVPRRRLPAKAFALAAILIALAAGAAIWRPDRLLHSSQRTEAVGVPVGVPDATPVEVAQPVPAASQPPRQEIVTSSAQPPATVPRNAPVAAENNQMPPMPAEPASPAATPAPVLASAHTDSAPAIPRAEPILPPEPPRVASAERTAMPAAPAPEQAAPPSSTSQPTSRPEEATKSTVAKSAPSSSKSDVKPKTVAAKRVSKSKTSRDSSGLDADNMPPLAVGSKRARFVGTTPEGNWILQLPNSETVVLPPAPISKRTKDAARRHPRRALPVDDEQNVAEPEPVYNAPAVPPGY